VKRRGFLAAAGAGAALSISGAPFVIRSARAQEGFKWRMANLYPRGISFGVVYEAFTNQVKAMSGGRLEIENVYDGEGVGATEVLQATKSGLVEMGAPYMALHAGELPAGVVELGLPGAPTQLHHLLALFYEGGWIEELRKAYAEHNLYYLGPYFQPGVYLLTKDEITSLDQLQGKVLRSPGGYGKFMRQLGAEPVVMAFSELYTSLATGVVVGAASSNLIDYRDGNFVEIAKYMYPVPLTGSQVSPVIVNMDSWNQLSDDLKAIMETAQVWHGIVSANKSTIWEKDALNEMIGKGLKWSPMPSDADKQKWQDAVMKLQPEYEAEDPHSKELLRLQNEFIAKYVG
jgi:TRAP-type mannitol/chloroaromatic compound transport system substrate-binding protein